MSIAGVWDTQQYYMPGMKSSTARDNTMMVERARRQAKNALAGWELMKEKVIAFV
ncbi:hypothetical protein KSX_03720 [Ktedonospora formicarum]|uniref:Uncharacterized protein n=1 Tax=Ktedonospora formicarum TaxID=2778364 RepID=A0A8J3HRC9_9CHLR|nr:hypothetical protein KSX_03720 [Ktedonospora formicarum]